MNNKNILIGFGILAVMVIGVFALIVIEFFAYIDFNKQSSCHDCGDGGWTKMTIKCDSKIQSKENAIECLSKFDWSNVNSNTSPTEIIEGFIKIKEYGFTDDNSNSIKIYNYRQWSIDEKGNIYLEEQLG